MKKASKSCKIIVDTNIWISFLIGKRLKGLQYYINDQSVFIISCDNDLLDLEKMGNTQIIKYAEFETIVKE